METGVKQCKPVQTGVNRCCPKNAETQTPPGNAGQKAAGKRRPHLCASLSSPRLCVYRNIIHISMAGFRRISPDNRLPRRSGRKIQDARPASLISIFIQKLILLVFNHLATLKILTKLYFVNQKVPACAPSRITHHVPFVPSVLFCPPPRPSPKEKQNTLKDLALASVFLMTECL